MRDADSRVEGRGYSLSSLRDSIRTRRDYVSPFDPAGDTTRTTILNFGGAIVCRP